jgi:hypothetical protein
VLTAANVSRLAGGQPELDLGWQSPGRRPLPIATSRVSQVRGFPRRLRGSGACVMSSTKPSDVL